MSDMFKSHKLDICISFEKSLNMSCFHKQYYLVYFDLSLKKTTDQNIAMKKCFFF